MMSKKQNWEESQKTNINNASALVLAAAGWKAEYLDNGIWYTCTGFHTAARAAANGHEIRIIQPTRENQENEYLKSQLSTLEGIIQKQKEALEYVDSAIDCLKTFYRKNHVVIPIWQSNEIENSISLVKEALALSPSTFASRFVEIDQLKKIVSAAYLTGEMTEESALYVQKVLASQQPEGAGKG